MPGHVFRNADGNSDAGDIRDRPAGGGDVSARTPARDMVRVRMQAEGQRRTNNKSDVDWTSAGYVRKGKRANADVAKGKTIVTYKFVALIDHHRVQEWQDLGWTIRRPTVPSHHDAYGVIGEYVSDRDEEPPHPLGEPS